MGGKVPLGFDAKDRKLMVNEAVGAVYTQIGKLRGGGNDVYLRGLAQTRRDAGSVRCRYLWVRRR